MTPEYSDYVNLIRNEAWKRIKKNPSLDFDELVSQGNLAFCLALGTWDPVKGKFSTHLWWKIKDQMGKKNNPAPEPMDDEVDEQTPESTITFLNAINNLGLEAKVLCSLIFDSPAELCDFTATSIKITQTNIRHYLRSLEWSGKKINETISEIKNMLKQL